MNTNKMQVSILNTAMQLANLHGFGGVTRDMIAARMGIAMGSVTYHVKNMRKLKAAMVERAIETENLKILGQAIAAKHPLALAAADELRKRSVLCVGGF